MYATLQGVTMRELGAKLRELRENRGLTRAELAIMSGVSHNTITHWEGPRPPVRGSKHNVIALARAVGLDVSVALAMAGYKSDPMAAVTMGAAGPSREQLRAQLLEMWDSGEMPDHLCQILVTVAGIALGRAPIQTVQSLSGHGEVPRGSAPQHHDNHRSGTRVAWGFRCLIMSKDVAARIAAEADQQQWDINSSC